MNRKTISYSETELAWIKANSREPRAEMHAAFCSKFGRDVSLMNISDLCKRNGWLTGRNGHFQKGNVPVNKWKRSARLQAGSHLATSHLCSKGYVMVGVDVPNPLTGFERRFVPKHRFLWEQQNGPIPKGMVLKCKGDRQNTCPSNWDLIPRGMLGRLNGVLGRNYDDAPADLKPIIMAIARLEHSVKNAGSEPQI